MAVVGLVVREGVSQARDLGREVAHWVAARKLELVVDERTKSILGTEVGGPLKVVSRKELVRLADPVVTLGGDGTLINVARYAHEHIPAMIGVNFGKLGFLTEISPQELLTVLGQHIEGKTLIGRRMLVEFVVSRGEGLVCEGQAVNEFAILKGVHSPLPQLKIRADGEVVMSLRGDGILLSTPTGSTAYSLSAGGSILHPRLQAFILTPVCPHSLTIRPVVLPADLTLTIEVDQAEDEVFAVVDGHSLSALQTGDVVSLKRAKNEVAFVRSPHKGYFEILRDKLNWALSTVS